MDYLQKKMKTFYKQIELCTDCPNLSEGSISNCLHNRKEPKIICSFLDMMEWGRDKENIKYPLSIPSWCPLPDEESINKDEDYSQKDERFTSENNDYIKDTFYDKTK
jgi:hypothetical protein